MTSLLRGEQSQRTDRVLTLFRPFVHHVQLLRHNATKRLHMSGICRFQNLQSEKQNVDKQTKQQYYLSGEFMNIAATIGNVASYAISETRKVFMFLMSIAG